jgi:DNA polymerase III epsilon subunit-like protein
MIKYVVFDLETTGLFENFEGGTFPSITQIGGVSSDGHNF